MDFKCFYKSFRKTTEYDKLLEEKEKDLVLQVLTSKEFMGCCYANDLFDNGLTISKIIKLYPPELHKIVYNTLGERLKARQKYKVVVAWSQVALHIKCAELHNKLNVKDKDYFNLHYPVRRQSMC